MKFLIWFLCFIGLAGGPTCVEAYECGRYPVMSTTKEDGTRIGLIIHNEQIEKTPKWSPGEGEPPLPLAQTIAIATKWAKGKYSRYDSVKVWSIDLKEFGCGSLKGHWYYIVHFKPVIDGNTLFGGGNFAAVLMDGTVIEPEIVKGDRF
ncbi:MAG: hypothetical protein V3S74_05645 [Alphaproteobacteria bacterium]